MRADFLEDVLGVDQGQVDGEHGGADGQGDYGERDHGAVGVLDGAGQADHRGDGARAEHDRHGQGNEGYVLVALACAGDQVAGGRGGE
ncbi:hypothetical protein D3C71_1964080 [compost metagenome]